MHNIWCVLSLQNPTVESLLILPQHFGANFMENHKRHAADN